MNTESNAEVLNNLEGVYQDLCKCISARKPPKSPYQGDLKILTFNTPFSHCGC